MLFASHTSLSWTLLLMLLMVLSAKNSGHGKAIWLPRTNKGRRADEKKNNDCPTQRNFRFPLSVKIDIHINSLNHAIKIAPDIRNRSISPWDYNITKDPNRFPEVIAEAKCRHYSCVDSLGQEDYSRNSVPIQQEILILRREQRGCQHAYRLEKKLVTVGCTCAVPVHQPHS